MSDMTFPLTLGSPLEFVGVVSIGDVASGGSVGSAATTVDLARPIAVNQTTTSKDLTLATPTRGLAMLVPVYNVGTVGFFMYGRYIRPGGCHKFLYVPSVGWRRTSSGPQVVAQSAVAVALTDNTSEQTAATFTFPAGTIGANGDIEIYQTWSTPSIASGNKTFRVKLGSSTLHTNSVTTTSTRSVSHICRITNRNSEASQVGTLVGGTQSSTTVIPTATENTAAAITVSLTGQASVAEGALTLERYSIILNRFD